MLPEMTVRALEKSSSAGAAEHAIPQPAKNAIAQELEAICSNQDFRLSPRNCEFLRYVVTATLAGRAAEIKERTLGTELFGRDASYDTGSDAVVRVRANDVRKRLGRHYEKHAATAGWRIELPSRTYVPLFLPENEIAQPADEIVDKNPPPRVLRLRQLMAPTLVALFLCAGWLRWQMSLGNPYLDFWKTFLQEKSSVTLVLDADEADPKAVKVDELHQVAPLLSVAEQFDRAAQIQTSGTADACDPNSVCIYISHARSPSEDSLEGGIGRKGQFPSHAAYLTVVPGPVPSLRIQGTDSDGIRFAIHELSTRGTFPETVATALHRNTVSRIRVAENKPVLAESVAADPGIWRK